MKKIFFVIFVILTACSGNNTDMTQEPEKKEQEKHFGLKKISQDGVVGLSEILAKLEKKENLSELALEDGIKVKGLTCKTSGTIVDICQMSGCWFTFKTDDGKEVYVQMKDHKPTSADLAGKTVVVEGIVYAEELSIEELRMRARDEGASRDELSKITKPQTKYNILADGAVVRK